MNCSDRWKKDYPNQEISAESLDENHSLKKMLRLVGENKRVVDFGCATGYFSQLLTKKGCSVVGVDINSEAAKIAEQYCEDVIVADLDFVSVTEILPQSEFDVAVFGDVLEHLRNPWLLLKETQQILKPDGYIVASIPNVAHGAIRFALLQGKFEYTELGILDSTHLRFFTRKTVEHLFESSGYFIEYIDRTKVPVFSESPLLPQIDKIYLESGIIREVEKDEEASTLQFIIRAFPATERGKDAASTEQFKLIHQVEQAQFRVQQTQQELAQKEIELQQAQSAWEAAQNQLQQNQTELEQTYAGLQQNQTNIEQITTQLQQAQSAWIKNQNQLQQTQAELQQTYVELQQKQTELEQVTASLQHIQVVWEEEHNQLQQTQVELQQTYVELGQATAKLQQLQAAWENAQIQLQQTQINCDSSQLRVKAMESSKFWKLRQGWFGIKRAIGLKAD